MTSLSLLGAPASPHCASVSTPLPVPTPISTPVPVTPLAHHPTPRAIRVRRSPR